MGWDDGNETRLWISRIGINIGYQRKGANYGHKWKILQVSQNINWLFEEERLKEIMR